MNLSRAAFLLSVIKLEKATGRLYFWTFTFLTCQDDDVACAKWAEMCMNARRHFAGVHGLRVLELHDSHGIHFHLLLNKRFPIRRMLALAKPFGFGRIGVEAADDGAGDYLAQYLKPGQNAEDGLKKHRRRWGAFGGFKACRQVDVEYVSEYQANTFLLPKEPNFRQRLVVGKYSTFGSYADWPDVIRENCHVELAALGRGKSSAPRFAPHVWRGPGWAGKPECE